jgi:hypothetical protein
MNALRDLYIRILVESAEFADQLARDALRRQPVQVALMHETDIEALFLPDAVAALRARGWEIVSIDEAYRDPMAAAEPDSPHLFSRIGALATIPGQPPRELIPVLNREAMVRQAFSTEVLHLPVPVPGHAGAMISLPSS